MRRALDKLEKCHKEREGENRILCNCSTKNNCPYAIQNGLYIVPKRKVKIVAQKDTSVALRASSGGGGIITPHILEPRNVGTT